MPAVPNPPDAGYTVEPQELHWAMHALVRACPREQYDAYQLPTLPSGPAGGWSDGARPRGRRVHVPDLPIFGQAPAKRSRNR